MFRRNYDLKILDISTRIDASKDEKFLIEIALIADIFGLSFYFLVNSYERSTKLLINELLYITNL